MHVDEFLRSVEDRDVITFVLFSADWCTACHPVKTKFATVSAENEAEKMLRFQTLDIDEEEELTEHCAIRKIPTVQVWSHRGLISDTHCKSVAEFEKVMGRFIQIETGTNAGDNEIIFTDDF